MTTARPSPAFVRLLREARRLARSRTSLWVLPALAYTALQLRLGLGGGGAHGVARGARAVHHLPSLKAVAPYVLGHVQAMPAVGGFALLLIAEGIVLWRARREVDDLVEPFAGPFADPRALAWVWLLAFVAFLGGTAAGWVLGPAAAGPRVLLLTVPAIALTQTLYTAQVVTLWLHPQRYDSLSQATWRAAPALPGLLLWELALTAGFALVLLAQARFLMHPGLHPSAVRLARAGVLVALSVRAAVAWVPVVLVADRCSLPAGLRRAAAMWRTDPWGTAVPLLALAAAFTVYAYVGAWLTTSATAVPSGVPAARALLGYGALGLHLLGAGVFAARYAARAESRAGTAAAPK